MAYSWLGPGKKRKIAKKKWSSWILDVNSTLRFFGLRFKVCYLQMVQLNVVIHVDKMTKVMTCIFFIQIKQKERRKIPEKIQTHMSKINRPHHGKQERKTNKQPKVHKTQHTNNSRPRNMNPNKSGTKFIINSVCK